MHRWLLAVLVGANMIFICEGHASSEGRSGPHIALLGEISHPESHISALPEGKGGSAALFTEQLPYENGSIAVQVIDFAGAEKRPDTQSASMSVRTGVYAKSRLPASPEPPPPKRCS